MISAKSNRLAVNPFFECCVVEMKYCLGTVNKQVLNSLPHVLEDAPILRNIPYYLIFYEM